MPRGHRPQAPWHAAIVAAVTAGDSARAMTERTARGVGDRWLQDHHRPGSRPRQPRATAPSKRAGQARRSVGRRHPRRHRQQRHSDRGGLRDPKSRLLERYRSSRSGTSERTMPLLDLRAEAKIRRRPGGRLIVAEPPGAGEHRHHQLSLRYQKPRRRRPSPSHREHDRVQQHRKDHANTMTRRRCVPFSTTIS